MIVLKTAVFYVADPQWWETSGQEFAGSLNDDHLAMVRDQGQTTQGEFIIAEGSTHSIPNDRPDGVIAAIKSTAAAGRVEIVEKLER